MIARNRRLQPTEAQNYKQRWKFIDISGQGVHLLALAEDGKAWTWGFDNSGTLGQGILITHTPTPSIIKGNISFSKLAAGYYQNIGINGANNSVWTWGEGSYGNLGAGNTTSRSSPVSIYGGHLCTNVDSGLRHCAILRASDGMVLCFGYNAYGNLGDNSRTNRSSPVPIVRNNSYSAIACQNYATFAIDSNDGSVWSWGYNVYGNLGDNSTISRSSPVLVVGNHSFIDIISGSNHTIALKADGSIWCWGLNNYGQLGDNTTTNRSSPVSVIGGHSFISLGIGYYHSLALKADGTLWTWGYNGTGELGQGNTTSKSSPVSIAGHSFIGAESGEFYCAAIKEDGKLYTWGRRDSTFAVGSAENYTEPKSIVSIYSYTTLYKPYSRGPNFIKRNDGTLWGWGYNTYGNIGDNSTTARASPVSVAGNKTFANIFTGAEHNVAIEESTNNLYTWGYNGYGGLGDNTVVNKSSPVLIASGTKWIDADAGYHFTVGMDQYFQVWTWGYNSSGALGLGDATNRSTPNLVTSISPNSFYKVIAHYRGVFLLAFNGSAWCWGYNGYGQLGDNTTTSKSTPVSVVGNHSFVDLYAGVYTIYGLKENGELWAWGYNYWGNFGNGNLSLRSSPVIAAFGHKFKKITAGYYHIIGTKADGSVWAWGRNDYGQLGTGDIITRSIPTQINSNIGNDFIDIKAGAYHTLAYKNNGTIWAWGRNNDYECGTYTKRAITTPTEMVMQVPYRYLIK